MAKRGRPRKKPAEEAVENPQGTVTVQDTQPCTVDFNQVAETDEHPTTWSATFNETQSQDIEPANISTAQEVTTNKYSRGKDGLLKSVKYEYNEDGSVNWRAMVDPKHLFPNKSWFEARNKAVPTSVDGLQDYQLLIKLAGIKELAKLRGYNSVRYDVIKCEKDHVSIKCEISWIPNFENPVGESDFISASTHFEDVANATTDNTSSFATKFLETIAANRAFVRCVRNFLNVHIVGDDEIDKSNGTPQHPETEEVEPIKKLTPNGVLESLASSKLKCASYTDFKDKLRELWTIGVYKNESAKDWGTYDDIPAKEARLLINIIKQD
jgi:hypothetical protein